MSIDKLIILINAYYANHQLDDKYQVRQSELHKQINPLLEKLIR